MIKRIISHFILFFFLGCTGQKRISPSERKNDIFLHCKITIQDKGNTKHKAQIEVNKKEDSDTIEYRIYHEKNELVEVGEFIVDTLPINCATIENYYREYPRLINKKRYLLGKFIINEVIHGDTTKYIKYFIRTNLIEEIRYKSPGLDSTVFYFSNGKFRGYKLGVIPVEYILR